MPRNKIRKTQIGLHTQENMKNTLDLIIEEHKSIRSVAKLKGIPFTTLRRYYKKYTNSNEIPEKLTPHYVCRQIFSDEQEETLVKYITNCCQMFYGLTLLEVRKLAYEMAIINKIENIPANWHEKYMAGIYWLYHFRKTSFIKSQICRRLQLS